MAIDEARSAIDRGDWQDALDLLDALGDDARSPAALELRALAAYGNGEFEASISAWEALYAQHMAHANDAGAAMAAASIALYFLIDTALMAPVRGWVRRAARLVADDPESPVNAMLAMITAYERFFSGDIDGAAAGAQRAIDLGTRLDVPPAVVIGRVVEARIRILTGDLDEGLAQLDEIATLLMSGEVDPLTTGMMYCELICAVQGLAMYERASEWTGVMERWRHGAAIGGIHGRCRVHRAEVLRLSGPCDAAETEALAACDDLRPWMRREFGWPLVELGTIRLRKGDLDGAEEAFLAAHRHAWSPEPGLALLRLEQGDADAAASLIGDAIDHPLDVPWKEQPPFGDLRLAPLLAAQVEIAAARGDSDTATNAAARLGDIASRYPSRAIEAGAALADAHAALLAGDAGRAADRAGQALVIWTEIGAPFEAAGARMVLGDARHRSGNHDGASMEWRAARDTYAEYGAARQATRAAARLGAATPPATRPVTEASSSTFVRDGDLRIVGFGGDTVTVRDLIGLRYIERLVSEPGREFHALDLVAVEQGTLPTGRTNVASQGMPAIDAQARDAYRRRLAEVDDDIEEATALNDAGRLERATLDREYLLAELSHAVGLGGRLRSVGSDAERARTSVTRSIRYALAQLARHHPVAATHLERAVRTGTYCSYVSDPLHPVTWRT